MTANNDMLALHDHGQAVRHLAVAKTLIERCPITGERLGNRRLRGNAQRLLDIYAIGTRHPLIWTGGAR